MFDIRRLGTAAMFLILLAAGPARAAPEVGWWWNPNESGRGFFVESQNGIIYLAGYFYEADGRATWLVSGGPNTDAYNYQGRLLAYRNGQTLTGDYKPPSTPTDAGPVSIKFSDDTHGTIVWPGGTIPIVRQIFGGESADTAPEGGWWWNDAESGRGYSIEVQGDKLFAVAFMYDAAGNPVWYYSAGTMSSPTRYAGPWLQFGGGQTLTGPYRPPGTPVVVGQLGIEFTAPDEATVTFSDAAGATESPIASRKQQKTFTVRPQFPKPKPPLPTRWTAAFEIEEKIVNVRKPTKSPGQTQIITWKWTANDVEFTMDDDAFGFYSPTRGVVVAFPTFFQITSDNKEKCESKPGQNFIESLRAESATLAFRLGTRVAQVSFNMPFNNPTVLLECTIEGKTSNSAIPLNAYLFASVPPKPLDSGIIDGRIVEQVILDYDDALNSSKRTLSARWTFLPVK
jgi:hypothetical protein